MATFERWPIKRLGSRRAAALQEEGTDGDGQGKEREMKRISERIEKPEGE
jgi:hypothetical protein